MPDDNSDDISQRATTLDRRLDTRRAFLKKAGLAAAAAGAMWAVPQMASVGPKPAYAAATSCQLTFSNVIVDCVLVGLPI